MKVATIIVHRNRPDLADHQAQRMKTLTKAANVDNRVLIVDCGSDAKKRTRHPSYWYPDPDFTDGKIRGHIVGVELLGDGYDYYWLNHPDVVFNDPETLKTMIQVMEENKEVGLLSPLYNGEYAGIHKGRPGEDWHLVATVEYLSFFIRGEALRQVGNLDPKFRFCVGADLDYGHRMWQKGWKVAFCDKVTMHHLGGTTYGAPGSDVPSREYYLFKSGVVAFNRLVEKYGVNWRDTMNKVFPEEIRGNMIDRCWNCRHMVPEVRR